jgi:hypothetical protein
MEKKLWTPFSRIVGCICLWQRKIVIIDAIMWFSSTTCKWNAEVCVGEVWGWKRVVKLLWFMFWSVTNAYSEKIESLCQGK